MKTTMMLETLYDEYKRAVRKARQFQEDFANAVVFKGFEAYMEQPSIHPHPEGDLMAYLGGSCLDTQEIISKMYAKGHIAPEDFLYYECMPKKEAPEPPHKQEVPAAAGKKRYEKRNCVSIKWQHPEDARHYFSVGVSLYARGYGWSARASDGERYYWKRGHYYETDKKAAYFALSSLLDWIGKPTDRIGKCMRLATWTNREQYNLRQLELFEQ